jgi:hypothetical protein
MLLLMSLLTQAGGLVSGILQPALCLQLGDSLLFDLTANPGRYPVRLATF